MSHSSSTSLPAKIAFFVLLLLLCYFLEQPFSPETGAAPSVELGFTSLSPIGKDGGEIIPASCESGFTHGGFDVSGCDPFTFTVDQSSVPLGGNTILRWSINPGYWYDPATHFLMNCQASGDWSGEKANGELQTPPHRASEGTGNLSQSRTYTYTLTCNEMYADGFVVPHSKTVTVKAGGGGCENGYGGSNPNACDWLTVSADSTDLAYGSSTTIRWRARGYNEAAPSPQVVQLQSCTPSSNWSGGGYFNERWNTNNAIYAWYGSEATPSLTSTQTFTLTCSMTFLGDNTTSVNTKSVTVNVGAAPVPVNQAPEAPRINGNTFGYPATYTFSMTGNDPDNDQVRYGMDWDRNGSVDEWTESVNSNTAASLSRPLSVGTYTFQALTQDTNGANSGFSSPHTIQIIAPPCACDRDNQVCSGQPYTSTGANCSASSCIGKRACGFEWEEVAP